MSGYSCDFDQMDSKAISSRVSYLSKALCNELILDCIFQNLNLSDVKNCRLVCHIWDRVAEPLLRNISVITFSPVKNTFENFSATFANAGTDIPFTAIKLQHNNSRSWENNSGSWIFSKLETLSEHWRYKIKSLELNNIVIHEAKKMMLFFICPIIQFTLTTLHLNCSHSSTSIIVSLDFLTSIKFLRMNEYTVLDLGTQKNKITPKEIIWRHVTFSRKGKRIENLLLNDIIDFSEAKNICIHRLRHGVIRGRYGTSLSLNMSGDITLSSLILEDVKLLGGSEISWNVTKLFSLNMIPWRERNKMKFTCLRFKNSTIDISILPRNIEGLEVSGECLQRFSCIFNNLKYLSLSEKRDARHSPNLILFRGCPQLTDLAYEGRVPPETHFIHKKILEECPERLPNLKLEELPVGIQKLEFSFPHAVTGVGVRELDTLILKNWNPKDCNLQKITNKLKPKTLVIDATSWGKYFKALPYYHFEETLQTIQYYQEENSEVVIYLGPIKISGSDAADFLESIDISEVNVQDSSFDHSAEYWFRFENGNGKTIHKSQFDTVRSVTNVNDFSKQYY